MTQFGLSNMDQAPVKFMIKCFEANYPESLGAVLIHKAPWVFQGIWKMIRGWLDPVVAGKIHFTNSLNDLAEFISPDVVVAELGGSNHYRYEYIEPVEGENSAMKDEAKKQALTEERRNLAKDYEAVIKEWAALPVEDREGWAAMAKKRDALASKLQENYWKLDPIVRARSIYDRNGEMTGERVLAKHPTADESTQTLGDDKAN